MVCAKNLATKIYVIKDFYNSERPRPVHIQYIRPILVSAAATGLFTVVSPRASPMRSVLKLRWDGIEAQSSELKHELGRCLLRYGETSNSGPD